MKTKTTGINQPTTRNQTENTTQHGKQQQSKQNKN